ncbi:MAG: amidohydrolase [Planctomycetaceae bacterium]|nr:amidohydrolase [Planctomycetaceae bacterium]
MLQSRQHKFRDDSLALIDSVETGIDHVVASMTDRLVDVRRHMHSHPEPSGEELETTAFIASQLKGVGLEPRLCKQDIGVVADWEFGDVTDETPRLAVRCDIDALRLPDQKDVLYRSQVTGIAHACGHDVHTSITLGSAMTLLQSSLNADYAKTAARLRFIFQPAEETCEGARWLVEQGVLDGVDAILALHVDPELDVGKVGLRSGSLTASCDEVDVLIEGKGGHGARPHQSLDPIAAAAQLVSSLYQALPRSVDSRQPSVLTFGKIAGGSAPNVIPECVELRGSLRAVNISTRDSLYRRIREVAEGVERMTGTSIRIRFLNSLPSVVNHPRIIAAMENAARRVVGGENTHFLDLPSMGGEDFAVYLEHVPGAMLRLGCSPVGAARRTLLHSPFFDVDEAAIGIGVRIMTRTALLLASDGFRG